MLWWITYGYWYTGYIPRCCWGTSIPNSPVLVITSQELADELVDPKAFGKSGESWVFAQVATIALLVFSPFSLDGPIDFIGVLLLATGVVFLWVRVCRDWGRLTQITMSMSNCREGI